MVSYDMVYHEICNLENKLGPLHRDHTMIVKLYIYIYIQNKLDNK